jgi:hypothetical protein
VLNDDYSDVPRICANCAYYVPYQMGNDGSCNAGGVDHGFNRERGDTCSGRMLFEVDGAIRQRRR